MDENPELAISTDKVCFVILLAREFDAKEEADEKESGSNPTDDEQISVLDDSVDDASEEELRMFLGELDEDEQIDLVALAWLGRGDGELSDWADLRNQAALAHNERTASYLMGIPVLSDLLEEGLNAFGFSCQD
jgi:hypothetical protein